LPGSEAAPKGQAGNGQDTPETRWELRIKNLELRIYAIGIENE